MANSRSKSEATGRISKAKVLTWRDKEILRRVGQGQLVAFGQLKAFGWPRARERTARERLARLEAANYLESYHVDGRTRGELVFTLTQKGAGLFSPVEKGYFTLGLPTPSEMKQQLWLQQVRLVLETRLTKRKARIILWLNERILRGEAVHLRRAGGREGGYGSLDENQLADARATIVEADGQSWQLDIEMCGAYYGRRLAEKVAGLEEAGKKSGHAVLWVTATKAEANRVRQAFTRAGVSHSRLLAL